MTRKERKEAADKRRNEIVRKIADIAAETVADGGSTGDAMKAADLWLASEVRKQPQQRAMYVEAVHAYKRMLAEAAKAEAEAKKEIGE